MPRCRQSPPSRIEKPFCLSALTAVPRLHCPRCPYPSRTRYRVFRSAVLPLSAHRNSHSLLPEAAELHSGMLYVGFWTDKGNADSAALGLLSKLRNKKIFLFGTAGFGGSAAYFQKILDHVKQSVDPSNTVVGEYMCQGKMPQSVRDRYLKMKAQPEHSANIDALIKNFDRAISHPDEDDLERLRKIILG